MLESFEGKASSYVDIQVRNETFVVDVDIKAMRTVELYPQTLAYGQRDQRPTQAYHRGTCLVDHIHLLLGNIEHLLGHLSNTSIFINRINSCSRSAGRKCVVSVIGNVTRR
jgi:hypothetical protein